MRFQPNKCSSGLCAMNNVVIYYGNIMEVIFLRDKIYRSSKTLVGADFTEAAEKLDLLLKLLRYHGVDTPRLKADSDHPQP